MVSVLWLAVVAIIIVLVPLVLRILLSLLQRKDSSLNIQSLTCMLVTLPRESQAKPEESHGPVQDFKSLIAPMEQLIASLTTTIHQRRFIDWLFSTPAHISFEIISVNGVISFAVLCPKRIAEIVERQIHSFFPYAELSYGAPPAMFEQDEVVKGLVFQQAKSFILPINTYKAMESDPLSNLTNVLTKLEEGCSAVIQLIIRPINENWRVHTHIASNHARDNKLHLINRSATGRTIGMFIDAVKPTAPELAPKQMTPQQEQIMKALQEKGSKTGFETILRVLSVARTEELAEDNLRTITAAFSQFYSPEFNSFRYKMLSGKVIAHDYLLRLFGNAPKMILNVEEITSIYHFPNKLMHTPGVKWLMARALPSPANLPEKGIVLGENLYRGEKHYIRLQEEDRRRHVFMIGKTGTGKTTLFELMIEQDMHEGKGVCFIDPLGDAIESLLKKVPANRAKDVIIFDPSDTDYPLGLNLLEYDRPEEKDFLIQEVIEIFYKLFDPNRTGIVGPQWEHWARNAALTVMSNPGGGSLIDIPRLFTDDAFRTASVANMPDPIVKAFWEQQLAKTADFHKSEMYNYFISKFGRFMTNNLMRNIIGQKKSSFDFRKVMDEGKILFVNLAKGKIGEINANLLGLVIVAKLQVAAFSRADITEADRKDFYLYVDEFQNFTTDTFATILAEARKYRLNLNITNQYFSQLTEHIRDAVIGNVGTLISYRIGAEDAEFLSREMPGLTVEDLTNLDRFRAYVKLLINLAPTKPFSLMGIKSPTQGSEEMARWLKMATQKKYAMSPVKLGVSQSNDSLPTT